MHQCEHVVVICRTKLSAPLKKLWVRADQLQQGVHYILLQMWCVAEDLNLFYAASGNMLYVMLALRLLVFLCILKGGQKKLWI